MSYRMMRVAVPMPGPQTLGFDWGGLLTSVTTGAVQAASKGIDERIKAAASGNPTAGTPVTASAASASSASAGSMPSWIWYAVGGGVLLLIFVVVMAKR